MNLIFGHPEYLWILVLVPLTAILHFLGLSMSRRKALQFANFAALERATGVKRAVPSNLLLLATRCGILVCLSIAVSGAVLWYQGTASSVDYVIALDASSTMLAKDIAPNRLEAAKASATKFLNSLPWKTKAGFVAFGGAPLIREKPTEDLAKVVAAVSRENTSEIGGTAIGEAIVTSSNLLADATRGRAIILITDGQSNVGVSIDESLKYAKLGGAAIYTIGVGTLKGGDFGGGFIGTQLDESQLQFIANETGGKYFHAESPESLSKAFSEIVSSREQNLSVDLTFYLIMATLVLLYIEWWLANLRYSKLDVI